MKKNLLYIFCILQILLFSLDINANEVFLENIEKGLEKIPEEWFKSYKIVCNKMLVKIDILENTLEIKAELLIDKTIDKIPYYAFFLDNRAIIKSIYTNGEKIDYKRIEDTIIIPTDEFPKTNDFKLEINYTLIDSKFRENYFKDKEIYNFYTPYFIWHPFQPFSSPSTQEITFVLAKSNGKLKVICDGIFLKEFENENEKCFIYKINYPLSEISFTVGEYKISNTQSGRYNITTAFLTHPNKKKQLIDILSKIIQCFSSKVVEPPYPNFTAIEIPKKYWNKDSDADMYNYGSTIFIRDDLLDLLEQPGIVLLLAHEVFHFWARGTIGNFGNEIDNLLQEGICEYASYIFVEDNLKEHTDKFLINQNLLFLSKNSKYSKGFYIFHMLRNIVGDEKFFVILKNYFEKFKGGTFSLPNFLQVCEEIYGKSLEWFFKQWLSTTPAPKFGLKDIKISGTTEEYNIKGILYQDDEIFKCPVEIKLITFSDEEIKKVFWITKKERKILFKCKYKPKALFLDPDWKILKFNFPLIVPLCEKPEVTTDTQQIYEYNLAKEFFNKEEYDKAEFWFRKMLKKKTNLPTVYNGLGLIYFEKGMYEKAEKIL
jgi:hypothetical protein